MSASPTNPDPERICSKWWFAKRIDSESVDVNHVCGRVIMHEGPHRCPCGAETADV